MPIMRASDSGAMLQEYIAALKNYKGFAGDIVCHRTVLPEPGVFASKESVVDPVVASILTALKIQQLYTHQKEAIELILQGKHTVVSTPTASGKSLIYNIPVFRQLVQDRNARALYLFPLKALARDQHKTLKQLLKAVTSDLNLSAGLTAAVYDGDISSYQKSKIRNHIPNIVLSNPEMLHLSLLAHHHLWTDFFRNLKYVIIDEVHTYRGVMGSNMAWVLRRFIRICRLYQADPVFIFSSATIANPQELTQQLTGFEVHLVSRNTAPSGQKEVILMKGAEGAANTAIQLIHAAIHRQLRTIVYTQSRKITELIAIWSSDRAHSFSDKISAYRAGFLPEERREIEKQLSSGDLLAVISTSALELGIDIGHLDICILVGYPGTIMSTWQRAGRVGRSGMDSALILIAHEDALDQYFVNHPDEFFAMPPERAVINPDNPVILKNHLECAAAELALSSSDPLLQSPSAMTAIKELETACRVLKSDSGNLWYAAGKSPHRHVNLRGTGSGLPIFLADTQQLLGEIDRHRAFFETHEGAVYLHRGESYVITTFDHENGVIEARPRKVNYYTRVLSVKSTQILEVLASRTVKGVQIYSGRLKIMEQVTGYQKKQVSSQKSLGIIPLDLPLIEFETQGLWIEIPDPVRETIESQEFHFMGGIHALEHAAIGIMPLLVMTDRNDLGGISIPCHPQTQKAAVFIYDGVPGGLGLTQEAYEKADRLLAITLETVAGCACENGCPACVHSPKCGSGNRPIDKASCLKILQMLNTKTSEPVKPRMILRADVPPVEPLPEAIHKTQGASLRYGVLDIETRRSADEVGGWHRAEKMGMSCAVLYDSMTEEYKSYLEEDIETLVSDLQALDLIIGFNIIRFDYKVLSGLTAFDFHTLSTLDLLDKIHERLGYRLSLDHLAKQTLNQSKSADGLMALEWFKQGHIVKIIDYCRQDVKVTLDLYKFGRDNGFLLFENKAQKKVRLPVCW